VKRTLLGILLASTVAVAACGSDDDDAVGTTTLVTETTEAPATSAAPATTEVPATTAAPTTAAPTTTEAPVVTVGDWTSIPGGEECRCSDGSPYELWERPADPTRVVLYLQGGGACFDELTCGPTLSVFSRALELGDAPDSTGIFDPDVAENPFATHSIVYVPYCTGDVHLGANVAQYGDVTIEHNGFANASKGLETLVANYPDLEQLVVVGVSAGSVAAPAFAGLAADSFPDAQIVSFGDSSGAYPDAPELNVEIGGTWGVFDNVPDWPVNENLTPADWSIPGLTIQSAAQHPDITFARFDFDADGVQAGFLALAGIPAADLAGNIEQTEAQIEAAGVDVASFVARGEEHTIVRTPGFYELEVGGVRLVDFMAALVAGEVPADVRPS
jgi:hypothetical protein